MEERFRINLSNKIQENVEAIEVRERKERNERIRKMLEEDVYDHFTNADFKKLLSPDDPTSLLEDMTFQIINVGIEQARPRGKEPVAERVC